MFDFISGGERRPLHEPAILPVVVSVVGHALLVSTLIVLPLLIATEKLPAVPDMLAFVVPPPPLPAPPPPLPPALPKVEVSAKRAPTAPETPPKLGELTFPVEPPPKIVEEAPAPASEGIAEGVEGGVAGGSVGGIVGGLVAATPQPPPPPALPVPVRIGGHIQAPALIHRVQPVFPEVAVLAQVRGTVILEAVVGADGQVDTVKVLRSVKFLDNAAVDAVKQWRYSPLILNGVPTPFVMSVTVSFSFGKD